MLKNMMKYGRIKGLLSVSGLHEHRGCLSMIKVILWDIDGTLLDFLAAERAAINSCFAHFGLGECTDEMLKSYSVINIKYWEALERGEMTKPQILVGRFREFFEKYNLDTELAQAFNAEYQVRLGDTIVFHKNALETVKALQGKVLQCVVTNGTKIAQDKKLRNSGLGDLMDHIFISEVLGIEKPGKLFFDKVFEVIGEYQTDEVMIVGDSLTSDIRGGNNAGILTCWYNPLSKENNIDEKVDIEIDDISQVLEIIKK